MERVVRVMVLAALVFSAAAAGCGSSTNQSESGGATSGGNAGTSGAGSGPGGANAGGAGSNQGGTNVGGAGAGAGAGLGGGAGTAATGGSAGRPDPSTATETQACLYYLHAQCKRRFQECYGIESSDAACPEVDVDCPDRYFSEGAQVTAAELVECGDRWRDASCSDLERGVLPDCPRAGTKAAGEVCMFGSQCASFTCQVYERPGGRIGCGLCATVVGEGQACDLSSLLCDSGLTCIGATCQAWPAPLPQGAECQVSDRCLSPNECLAFPSQASPTCQPLPGLGEPCPSVEVCEAGAYCCSEGSECDTGGICVESPGVGEPCDYSVSRSTCAIGLHCDDRTGVFLCTAPIPLGEPCSPDSYEFTDAGCEPGLLCLCTDETCMLGVCVNRRELGESCGDANTVCIPGTTCQGGVCVETGSQGRFAQCG